MPMPISSFSTSGQGGFTIAIRLAGESAVLHVAGDPEETLGYSADDFISGRISLISRVHPDDQDVVDILLAPTPTEATLTANLRLRRADGRICCVKATFDRYLEPEGLVLRLLIHDAKRLARTMEPADSNPGFRVMMENTDDYIYFKDRNHVFTGASQTLVSLCSPAEHWTDLLGQTDYDLFPEAYADLYYRLEKQVFARVPVAHEVQETLTTDGRKGWVDNRKYPIENDRGEIIGLYGIARDITRQVQVEMALRTERDAMRNLLATVEAIIVTLDRDGRITLINRKGCELLGYAAGELEGQDWFATCLPNDGVRNEVRALFANILAGDLETTAYHVNPVRMRDDRQHMIAWHNSAIRDQTGAIVGVLAAGLDMTEQHQTERALRERDLQLRSLGDNLPHGFVYQYEVEQGVPGFRYISASIERALGLSSESLTRDAGPLFDLIPPEAQAEYAALEAESAEQLSDFSMSLPFDGADGRRRWFLIQSRPRRICEDTVVWDGVALDITDQHDAEMRLQESEERFRRLFEETRQPTTITEDGRIIAANAAVVNLLGLDSAEQLIGRSPADFSPSVQPDGRASDEKASELISQAFEQGSNLFEWEHLRTDGQSIVIEVLLTVIPFGDKDLLHGVWNDITDKKRAEAELQDAHRQLLNTHFAMDQVGIGIQWVEVDTGRFLYVNDQAARMLGYEVEELLNLSVSDIDPDFPPGEFKTLCGPLFESGSARFESRQRHKDGTLIPVEVHGHLRAGKDGKPAHFITFISDITERNEARDALLTAKAAAEQATRSKSDFLANMSHEIRTPMNAVLGLAYLLTRQELPEEALSLARKIQSSGQSLLGIINDILDLSKIESGKIELEQAPFQLSQVLDNLATIMAGNAQDKAIELLIIPPVCSDWTLRGDPLHLGQVLINLTNNAIKFTDAGWVKVRISVIASSHAEVKLRFSVRDTGIGIDSATQARLFQPFVQADASTQRRFGGSGLGLVIARRLVELMGGAMGLDSAPGQGSTFWFELPFAVLSSDPGSVRAELPMRVLIVAEQALLRDGLLEIATALGWSATVACNQTQALDLISRDQALRGPDAAVLLGLRDTEGYAIASVIRAALPKPDWPLLFALGSHQVETQPTAEVVDAVLTKPLTSSPLHDAVVLARHRRFGMPIIPEPALPQNQRLRDLRLLVVDDNAVNCEVARGIFTDEGARVSLAFDGREALDWLIANACLVDAVLMDVQMPVMDGLEATRAIRQHPLIAELPVIALTAGAMPEQQASARDAGVDGFLSKPFDVEQAVALIGSLTGRSIDGPPPAAPVDVREESNDSRYPGINLQQALTLWKNSERYCQYLRKFADEQARTVERIAGCEPDAGRRLAHSIKGAAGNLGLDQVASAAGALERLFLNSAADASIADATAELEAALSTALKSIACYIEQTSKQNEPVLVQKPGSPDPARIAELIRVVHQAFEDFEPTLAEVPLAELASVLPAEQLAPLKQAVENFDASQGSAATRVLAEELGIALEEDGWLCS